MAEKAKKKSFIFNVEWQEILLGYPSEVRLEVYDAIIEYVASGTILELKPMAKMAFSFIKKEIDYNTCKYNDIVAKRSEAGKKSMNKRYNKDATNLTNDSKSNKCYQDATNLTVNDNDNVNVNESPNGDKVDAFLPEISDKPLKECYEELSTNSSWIETVVMNKRSAGHPDFTLEHFQEYLKKFFEKLQNEGEIRKSPKDGMAHFVRWLDIELGKSKTDMYKAANEQLLLSVKEDKKGYYQFLLYIKRQAPYCFSNMRLPTEEEFLLLRGKYGNEMFKSALRTIEGRSDIRSKWDVLYYAVLKQFEYQNGS
ncbi:DUF6291 domain-containing protein [Bacteroides clarus]|uniref:DUF6291 domain-containing protein n=1 Tax=Bacteroides clarus TaxID=626929 RepID=UPI0021CB2CCD|nr:DUF6291 domain-containing protein [Bacteroides clarus]